MNITAVTISHKPERFDLFEDGFFLHFHCEVGPDRRLELPRNEQQSRPDRVNFLAQQRDIATRTALETWPETTHIFNIESYYLDQQSDCRRLMDHYIHGDPKEILGGCVWGYNRTREGEGNWFYDRWATPEMRGIRYETRPFWKKRVTSVGSAFIFPVEAYHKNGFTNEGFPERFYYTNLCRGFQTYIDGTVNFWRQN